MLGWVLGFIATTHSLAVLSPEDSRVINTMLNVGSVLGIAYIGYKTKNLSHIERMAKLQLKNKDDVDNGVEKR